MKRLLLVFIVLQILSGANSSKCVVLDKQFRFVKKISLSLREPIREAYIGLIRNILIHDGKILVLGYSRIMMYDMNGNFLRFLGRPGGGPGEFIFVGNFNQNEEGKVVVYSGPGRINVYDKNLNFKYLINFAKYGPYIFDLAYCRNRIFISLINHKGIVPVTGSAILSEKGKLLKFFFDYEKELRENFDSNHLFLLHECGKNSIYLAPRVKYEIREYSLDGELIRKKVFQRSWFVPIKSYKGLEELKKKYKIKTLEEAVEVILNFWKTGTFLRTLFRLDGVLIVQVVTNGHIKNFPFPYLIEIIREKDLVATKKMIPSTCPLVGKDAKNRLYFLDYDEESMRYDLWVYELK